MKKLAFSICLFVLFICACKPNRDEYPQTDYKPILMTRSDLEASVKFSEPRILNKTGKIYKYGNYLFISEMYEGIHIIDNTNPLSPVKLGFMVIPGCVDMAIKNGMLYADNATDLVTIDLTNPGQPILVDRDKNVFPEPIPPDNSSIPETYAIGNRPENTVIIKWKR